MASKLLQDNVYYLLSSKFNYSIAISDAVGFGYARSLNLPYVFLNDLEDNTDNRVYLVDNRITEEDCKFFKTYLKKTDTIFIFKIIDPYYEWCQNHHYYKLIFEIAPLKNVYFLSVYTPEELVLDLYKQHKEKFLILPYPYQQAKESFAADSRFEDRIRKIIFTGNVRKGVYPNRYKFQQHVKYNPLVWGKIDELKHPGYADLGTRTRRHEIIGEDFVRYLAKYQFMFIEPSRCRLEFMKYSECGYANCVPVGEIPSSFENSINKYFVEFDFNNVYKSIRKLFSMPTDEALAIANGYRAIMRKERDQHLLRKQLDAFVENIYAV